MSITYYVYFDDRNVPFFLNSSTNETSYEIPENAIILDPKTNSPWTPPKKEEDVYFVLFDESNRPYFTKKDGSGTTYECPKNSKILDYKTRKEWKPVVEVDGDDDSDGGKPVSAQKAAPPPSPEEGARNEPTSPKTGGGAAVEPHQELDDEDVVKAIDAEFASKIHEYQIQDYAKEHFREHTAKKKKVPIDALVSFTPEPLSEPLLLAVDKNLVKPALQCFKLILTYTGVISQQSPEAAAETLVNNLREADEVLRDEVYFQLIKQTSHTPNNQILHKTLELFLIIATIYRSSKEAENFVKAHLASLSKHPDILVASAAQFTYIRFSSRCASGRDLKQLEENYVKMIPQQVSMGWQTFGASIYEMMWNQRTKEPRLPIPFIEYYMTSFLLKLGATKQEGIFRIPGNLAKVESMATGINSGKDMINGATLNDVASLFKQWFRDLPNPVVPIDRVPDVVKIYQDGNKDFIPFCNTLPRPHKMVLMFLVGFLQDLSKYKSETKMDANNLSIVFGPNIIQSNNITEQDQAKDISDIAKAFLMHLINNWDTSEIYPMQRKYFTNPPPDMP